MKIGLLSDTHGSLPEAWTIFFKDCNEIWHAGDIGNLRLLEQMEAFRPIRAVYGNIDSHELRNRTAEILKFELEGLRVMMTHIGGYPGHYATGMKARITSEKPGLFIAGHSHILKIMYDKQNELLYLNPGAAGKFGFHLKRTMIRFEINAGSVENLEIWEKDKH